MIDEKVPVSLGAALSIGAAAFAACWWLGRKLQALEDGQEQAKLDRELVRRTLDTDRIEMRKNLREIFKRLNRLPCNTCKTGEDESQEP